MKSIMMVAALTAALGAKAEIKVGVIGCDTSHTIAFTEIMNIKRPAFADGFRMTHAYKWGSRDIASSTNRYPKYIAQLQSMGVKMVSSIAELLENVDCVCLETCDGRPHLAQAEEVFKSGKLVFIDKPIAHDYADAKKIYELGKRMNAKYFSSSALRFADAQQACYGGKYGKIAGAYYFAPSPVEEQGTHSRYTWYGIHGFEPLIAVMGTGVKSVRTVVGTDCDEVSLKWKDGRVATLRLSMKKWDYGGFAFPEKGAPVALGGYEGYMKLLERICGFFKTGVVPVPNEETLEIFAVMDAAEKSYQRGGALVEVEAIPSVNATAVVEGRRN